jgi:hypothetical protein
MHVTGQHSGISPQSRQRGNQIGMRQCFGQGTFLVIPPRPGATRAHA